MEPSKKPVKDLTQSHIGSVWKKGKEQVRVLSLIRFKDPQDSGWYQAVIFAPIDNSTGMSYGRYETDFLKHYKPAPQEGESNASS